jgi:hypothetical protein
MISAHKPLSVASHLEIILENIFYIPVKHRSKVRGGGSEAGVSWPSRTICIGSPFNHIQLTFMNWTVTTCKILEEISKGFQCLRIGQ